MTQAATNSTLYGKQDHAKPVDTKTPAGTSPELARLLAMETTIRGASPEALAGLPALEAAVRRAEAIEALRAALTDSVMSRFYPLMNSALGFRTDRPNKRNAEPYGIGEVREVFVEALLLGLPLTDNRFNIISGRCYVTREGLSYLLSNCDGLTDLRIEYGVPVGDRTKGVVIPCHASWMLKGVSDSLNASIPVKGDEYSTLDQLLGKADRKFKARIYNRVAGSTFTPEGEVEEIGTLGTTPAPAGKSALEEIKRDAAAASKPAETTKPTEHESPRAAAEKPPETPEPAASGWTKPKQADGEGKPASITTSDIDRALGGKSGEAPPWAQ